MAKPQKNHYFNSKKLLLLRLNSGLTLNELSKKLGLSSSSICVLESDRKNPSVRVIIEYCLYFGLTPTELINSAYSEHMNRGYVNRLLKEGIINPETAEKILAFHNIK